MLCFCSSVFFLQSGREVAVAENHNWTRRCRDSALTPRVVKALFGNPLRGRSCRLAWASMFSRTLSSPSLSFQRSAYARVRPRSAYARVRPRLDCAAALRPLDDTILASSGVKPLLVDFNAVWCGPCALFLPIVEEVGRELEDWLQTASVDIELQPEVASRYAIGGLPTLLLFKNGKIIDRSEGLQNRQQLLRRLRPHLDMW